jgi:hypothetical protein
MKHIFYKPEDCNCIEKIHCPICEGGLAMCKICKLAEGSLTTDCPGEIVDYETETKILRGELDYREDEGGWVNKPNPVHQQRLKKVRQ